MSLKLFFVLKMYWKVFRVQMIDLQVCRRRTDSFTLKNGYIFYFLGVAEAFVLIVMIHPTFGFFGVIKIKVLLTFLSKLNSF